LLIALFSRILFKVSLSTIDKLTLLISFCGVILLISGTVGVESSTEELSGTSKFSRNELIIPSILLIIIPFNGAAINLFLRQMRDLSEITLGVYIVMAMFVVYAPIVAFSDQGLSEVKNFNSTDWTISVLLGFTSSSM
jgi:hypothetical protein